MIAIECKSCGQTVEVNSLLAAAQQPCPHCRKLLMGEMGPSSLKEPPPLYPTAAKKPRDKTPPGPFNFVPLTVGTLLGIIVAMAFAVMGRKLDLETQGMILGMFAGVLGAPLIALSMFLSAMTAKTYWHFSLVPAWDEILSESLMDGLALAVNERRFGKAGCLMSVFIVIGMGIGALIGSDVEEGAATISPWLVAMGVLGAASLGALIGLFATPYFPAPPPEPTEPAAEKKGS